ncbi:MAG: bifunctional riboflavin kinase/FAD synthetase [Legionellales bacterium]|nr:bifunctional riboflavin kinase/FAD synthetase [Legionellales bacterium]
MQIIRDLSKATFGGCVATIGNFDGVHLGHQAMLRHLSMLAQAKKLPLVVVTFEPLPQEFFAGDQNTLLRLTRLSEKLMLLQAAKVDAVVCLRFNQTVANWQAETFIEQLLIEQLQVKYLLVGRDFRFGHQRGGDVNLLSQYQDAFALEVFSAVDYQQQRISSTLIRLALAQGNLAFSNALLGHRYFIRGRVIYGDQRGRTMGFPTANIALRQWKCPLRGVFVVQVQGLAKQPLPGVANVGVRPTVDGRQQLLEVHLLDFQQSIYGKRLRVEFLTQLRDEQRFTSVAALRQQIQHDVEQAKQWWADYATIELD